MPVVTSARTHATAATQDLIYLLSVEGMRRSFDGFRCAADGGVEDDEVPVLLVPGAAREARSLQDVRDNVIGNRLVTVAPNREKRLCAFETSI